MKLRSELKNEIREKHPDYDEERVRWEAEDRLRELAEEGVWEAIQELSNRII